MSTLETAITTLASTPDSDTNKASVINAATSLSDQLRSISSSIQSQRTDADSEIGDDVNTINQSLTTISNLNSQIVSAKASGQSTADLEDQRTTALRSIASDMDVNYYTTSNGAMNISTKGGTALLDAAVHELSYTPASSVGQSTTFDGITVDGNDITSQITSGSISSLVTMRDTTLPNAQSALNTFASTLMSKVNAVTADGSAVPAPSTLTGTTSVSSSDAFSATGSMRVSLVDSSGVLQSSSDIDLSSFSTVGDVLNALNSVSGVSASIDADGQLLISSTTSGDGVAIGALTSSVGSDSQSFSSYFGLNSVFTGSDASDIAINSDLTSDPSKLATGTLSSTSDADGDTVLTAGDATVADALQSVMSNSYAFDASGGLGAQTVTLTNYSSAIVANIASTATAATSNQTAQTAAQGSLESTYTSDTGVNIDEETSNLSDYERLYNSAAQVMSTVNTLFSTMLDVAKTASQMT
jgi:flagellar hook-associated protein 1 FlgK